MNRKSVLRIFRYLVIFAFSTYFIRTMSAQDTFNFIVGADPQAWRLDSGDPNSSQNEDPWKGIAGQTYQSMRSLGAKFAIIDGDMTEYGRSETWKDSKDAFSKAGIPILYGLGNHDYANNVNDCADGFNTFYDNCALNSVNNLYTEILSQLANKYQNYGRNFDGLSGLNLVRADVTYDVDSDEFLDRFRGSLAYSFEYGGVHFIQLNYCPTYKVNLKNGSFEAFINDSLNWLTDDINAALYSGYKIVLNYHDATSDHDQDQCRPSDKFLDLVKKVDVVFSGHTHVTNINDANIQGVPHMTAGAIFRGDYYLVSVSSSGMTVTAYNGKTGTAIRGDTRFIPMPPKVDHIVLSLPNGDTVSEGGSLDAVATVVGISNQTLPGIEVSFAPSAGFSPNKQTTASNGQAKTSFILNEHPNTGTPYFIPYLIQAAVGGVTSNPQTVWIGPPNENAPSNVDHIVLSLPNGNKVSGEDGVLDVIATVYGKNNQTLSGIEVSFGPSAWFSPNKQITASNGEAKTSFTFTENPSVEAPFSIQASVGDVKSNPQTVYVESNENFPPTVDHIVLSLPNGDRVSEGGSLDVIATVVGVDNQTLSGIEVSFGPPAGFSPNKQTTTSNGEAKTRFTLKDHPNTGTPYFIPYLIQASVGDVKSNPQTVWIGPPNGNDPSTVDHIVLSLPHGDKVSGGDALDVIATVYGKNNQILPGVEASFDPVALFSPYKQTTASNGEAKTSFTLKDNLSTETPFSIQVSVGDVKSNPQTVYVEPNENFPLTVDHIALSLPNGDRVPAGGSLDVVATVYARNNQKLPGIEVTFFPVASFSPYKLTTASNGQAKASFTVGDHSNLGLHLIPYLLVAAVGDVQSNSQTVWVEPPKN